MDPTVNEKRGNWTERNRDQYHGGYHPEHQIRAINRHKDEVGFSGPFILAGLAGVGLVGYLLFRS